MIKFNNKYHVESARLIKWGIRNPSAHFITCCTKNIRRLSSNTDFAWQDRFHDHIIRDAESYERIEKYIRDNPLNWSSDMFNDPGADSTGLSKTSIYT